MYQFKTKDSEIKKHPLCLGNIQKIFQPITWKKKGLNKCVYDFSVDYKTFATSDIIDIQNVNENTWYKIMFGIILKMFIMLLTSLANASSHTKCVSLTN